MHETCSMGQGSFHLPLSLPTRSTWQPVCNNCPGWYSVKESTRGRRGITCHVIRAAFTKGSKKETEKHISFLKVVQRCGITASPRHHTPWPTQPLPPHHHHHTTTPPHHHTTHQHHTPPKQPHHNQPPTFPYLGPKGRHWPRCVCLVLWRLCWCQRTGAVFFCPVHNGPRGT